MSKELFWVIVGFTGQAFFSARFLVQWIASEYVKKSVIPLMFWYFSIFGGLTLLSYAIYRRDPVFIVGQSTGIVIYLRNLQLIYKQKKSAETAVPPSLQHE